jgi:Concanavalin A-like lectin/glucanases superfamily
MLKAFIAASILVLSGSAPTPPPGSPTPDILWWKMSNGSGTAITAAVGGAGTTDATWLTGSSGSGFALGFNGSSQEATSNAAVTYGASTLTLTVWLYINDRTTTQIVVESSVNNNTVIDTFYILIDAGNLYVGIFGNSGNNTIKSISAPATGAWHHYACIYDNNLATAGASGNVKLYLDGSLQSMTDLIVSKDGINNNFSSNILYLGARGGTTLRFNGRLDDLRIYTTELTSTQIGQIYADPQ